MAKIKRLKDKNGVMHTLGDADVSAYESTLSGAATNVPYSTAVKAYADGVGTTAATNLATHTNNQNNPHNVTASQVGLGNVDNKSSATIRSEITSANVTSALGYTPIDSAEKGVANGVATLGADAKIPAAQLPSYVDDVVEGYLYNGKFYKESTHTTEIAGETGKIYTDMSTNKTYRWSGSKFTEISASLALGETSSTAYRGDRGKTAYDHSQISGDTTVHHTHTNKTLLDSYTQSETDLADAVSKKHSHTNKEALDSITAEKIAAWDAKQGDLVFDGTYDASTNKVATVSSVTTRIEALDATKTSTDGTNVQVKVTETDGKVTAVNITTDNTENKNNKVTSWSATTSDTNYPSEKLVKSALDGKQATLTFDGTYNASTNKAATVSTVTNKINALDAEITSTDGTNVQVKVTETDGKVSAVNITTDNTENKTNKVSAWSATTSDTNYPSEKLVKDSLDGKVDDSQVVTSWSTTTSDTNIPSEKLVKDALDGKQAAGNYKTTQTAKTDPTASGTSATFIATISQNANGEITATKKTVQSASASQAGLMSKDHYSKVEGITAGATKVESSTTNGKIKINGTETTVYTHPTTTAVAAAAVKVGKDSSGHVVLGSALAKGDVGLGNVDNKSSETIRSEITSDNVTTALGFTPMASTVGLTVTNDDDGYYVELT